MFEDIIRQAVFGFVLIMIIVGVVSEKQKELDHAEEDKHPDIRVGLEYTDEFGSCWRVVNCYLNEESFLARKPSMCSFKMSCEERKICGSEVEC